MALNVIFASYHPSETMFLSVRHELYIKCGRPFYIQFILKATLNCIIVYDNYRLNHSFTSWDMLDFEYRLI